MAEASGFECPMCGHLESEVERFALPQLELKCKACGWEWAVEP